MTALSLPIVPSSSAPADGARAAAPPALRSVSVVVPCRNEVRHIERFLESLMRQQRDGLSVEVLVADGQSDDGTRALLEAARDRWGIRIIDNPERTVSTGLNRCIREARGDVVVRMDVHTEFAPDYLVRSVEILEATGADNVGGPALTRADGYLATAIATAYHSPFACGGARFHQAAFEGAVDTVTYGCWRRSLFDRLGYFDEALVRNQDDELNLRIVRAGGTVWQSPRIVSWYRPRTTLRGLFRQYFQYGFWKVAVIRKHRRPASWRHLVPAAFVLGLLTLAVVTLGSALAGWTAARNVAGAALLASLAVYTLGAGATAVWTGRDGRWRLVPVLPIVFATYHVSYGAGFLLGLVAGQRATAGSSRLATLVTRISR